MNTTAPARTGVRLLLVVISLAAGVAGQYWLREQPMWSASAWIAAAVGAIALFFLGRDAAELPAYDRRELSPSSELAAVVLVMLVGIFFVCFRISEVPAGLNHDAAWEGMYAIRILNGEPYTPYTPEAWGRETLTFYFRAAAIKLMGPTMYAVLAPGMIAGILTLPFFYWWLRTMFGVRLALVATTFLAASGWHLIFSRTGWRSDYQPFFMAFTCCFFARGLQTAKPMDFFLSGLGLALTLNIYNGARVFPGVFVVWLALMLVQSWHWRGFVRRYGFGLLVMGLAFAIAIAPLAWFAIHDWNTFQGRAAALRGASTFGSALRASLLLFNYRGNGDDFFIDTPALEAPAAVLLAFGVLWCVLRWRDERAQVLLAALVINLIPGLVSKPNLNRDVGTMIFVYAFVGLGAAFLAQQLRRAFAGAGRAVSGVFLSLACVAAMVACYVQYLGPDRRPIWGFYPETTVIGRYIKDLVPQYSIWVGGANFPRDALTYLSYQGSGEPRPNYVWLDDVRTLRNSRLAAPRGKGLAFVLANEGHGPQVLAELKEKYPNHVGRDLEYPAGSGRVFAKALLVPPEGAPAPTAEAAEKDEPAAAPPAAAIPANDLQQPRGVAVRPNGNILVSDFGHHRFVELSRDGAVVSQHGTNGDGPGQFKEPTGIAVAADGRVAIADTWNGRVQFFSAGGERQGQTAIALYGARGVAFAPDGTLYIADTGNNRVLHVSTDGSLLPVLGAAGAEPGKFAGPVGLAVGADGRVYVADNANGRLQIFSKEGASVATIPIDGWENAVYSEPYVALDGQGRIWVTVPLRHEVRAYDAGGRLLRTVKPSETRPGPFDTPMGIAYDPGDDELVVSDLAGRIVRFKAEG